MRIRRSLGRDESKHLRPVELHGLARGEIVGEDDMGSPVILALSIAPNIAANCSAVLFTANSAFTLLPEIMDSTLST